MERSEILKYFDFDFGSGCYDSKDGKYTIAHIGKKWFLLGVTDVETHNEYTDCGEYKTLSDAVDFYISTLNN